MATFLLIAGIFTAVLIVGIVFLKKYQPERKPVKIDESKSDQEYFPKKYDKNELVLMVRDPEWLHAYWEITATKQHEISQQLSSPITEFQPVLRIYNVTDISSETDYYDIPINQDADNWYIHVGKPNHTFYADLGHILPDGNFYKIASSNRVTTPSNTFSNIIDPYWVPNEAIWNTFFENQSFEELFSSLELFSKRSD